MQSPVDVVVGDFYEVPVINNSEFGNTAIILPCHRDGPDDCLNDIGLHYHIDWRFEPRDRFYNNINGLYARCSSAPRLETRRCLQEFSSIDATWPFMLEVLYEKFEDFELGEDRVCPHRGTIISNKCGVCPAHGLRWNFRTRKLMYKPPFYFVLPDGQKSIIKHGKSVFKIENYLRIDHDGITLKVVDSKGSIYKNASFHIKGPGMYHPGEMLRITDKNCGAILQ